VLRSVVDRRLPLRGEFLGLVVLCFGVTITISEAAASGDAWGVGVCLASVLAAAAMLTSTAQTLGGKVDSVQLAFFTGPVTFACLAPLSLAVEAAPLGAYLAERGAGTAAKILLSGGAFAFCYNIVHNDLVAITDAVTTCVLGQLKMVGIMILSAVFLGQCRGRGRCSKCRSPQQCAALGRPRRR
jgi:hypothetical protein